MTRLVKFLSRLLRRKRTLCVIQQMPDGSWHTEWAEYGNHVRSLDRAMIDATSPPEGK